MFSEDDVDWRIRFAFVTYIIHGLKEKILWLMTWIENSVKSNLNHIHGKYETKLLYLSRVSAISVLWNTNWIKLFIMNALIINHLSLMNEKIIKTL